MENNEITQPEGPKAEPQPERNPNFDRIKTFQFHGTGSELFKIFIINALLTIATLGLYYPWAKAKLTSYNYGHSEFLGSRLTFHGTGKEMFRGFMMGILIIGSWYGLSWVLQAYLSVVTYLITSVVITIVGIVLLTPLLIHGTLRYRTSRSSWRGLYFQYRGNRRSLYKIMGKLLVVALSSFIVFITFFFFALPHEESTVNYNMSIPSLMYFNFSIVVTAIITGIYYFWIRVEIYNYVFANLKLGNMSFKFTGKGGFYFLNYIYFGFTMIGVMIMLMLVMAGLMAAFSEFPAVVFVIVFMIYFVIFLMYMRLNSQFFNYTTSNIRMHQYSLDKKGTLKATTNAWHWFMLYLVNAAIIVFSLGIATPWAMVRTMNFYAKHITILGGIDFDKIEQMEVDLTGNAGAEGLYDAFDYDLQII